MVAKLDENKALKNAFLAYVPMLEKEFTEQVTRTFERMKMDLGPQLENVHKSSSWRRTFTNLEFWGVIEKEGKSTSKSYLGYKDKPYMINAEGMKKKAHEYAEDTALNWYGKMVNKLVVLDDVKVSDPRGYDVDISGHYQGDKVEIHQQIITKSSPLGTIFNQFPARIYVNGKFQSEVQYKKTIQGWGIEVKEKPQFQYMCKSCGYTGAMGMFKGYHTYGLTCPKCKSRAVDRVQVSGEPVRPKIDPNSRPREFTFRFKKAFDENAPYFLEHNRGRVDEEKERAKGMTEEEAWKKIVRQYNSFGGYKPLYDKQVTAIRTWNSQLIWSESSGDPKPVDGIIPDVDMWTATTKERNIKRIIGRASSRSVGPGGMGGIK